jgi:hypothetical protein
LGASTVCYSSDFIGPACFIEFPFRRFRKTEVSEGLGSGTRRIVLIQGVCCLFESGHWTDWMLKKKRPTGLAWGFDMEVEARWTPIIPATTLTHPCGGMKISENLRAVTGHWSVSPLIRYISPVGRPIATRRGKSTNHPLSQSDNHKICSPP